MTPDSFTNRTLPAHHQYEAWLEWFRPVLDATPLQPTDRGFASEMRLWRLGGFALSHTTAPPVRVVRNRRNQRLDPVDHWVVSYCARGAHAAITAGTLVEVPAKVPFLWSLGQEFEHERTHVDRVQFILSRDAFRDVAPLLDAACGSTLDTPLGRLLGDYMLALERHLPEVEADDFSRLTSAAGAMVAAAVAPSAERLAVAGHQIDFGRKERVREAVRRHLRTPTLRPRTLGRLVGMSRSNLYRLFEDAGGIARYIQNQRLLAVRAILTDRQNRKSIAALAEEFCFADASSFNRAFKREFGCSPGEVRAASLAGLAPPVMNHMHSPADRFDFGDLLRRF
jgi:AraC-like DNA-binding protein